MDSPQQDELPLSSPESSRASSTALSILPSSYLTVPSTRPTGASFILPGPRPFEQEDSDLLVPSLHSRSSTPVPQIQEPLRPRSPGSRLASPTSQEYISSPTEPVFMSVYSASSAESEQSIYSNPPARVYRVPSFRNMSNSRKPTAVGTISRFPCLGCC